MSKKLVAYFSASGVTKEVANNLAEGIDADIYEIKPKILYTSADLNWRNKNSRSSIEMKDLTSRPQLDNQDAHIEDYDTIFLGFPIWWHVAPTIINTFLESYDFSDKTVILFATSGGSGFGKTLEYLKGSVSSTTTMKEGKLLRGFMTKKQLSSWIKSLDIE